ncbi:uncharacterized protein L203_103404 [Cryptococcus depauperatus CBS 7841]|uniref:Glutaredoxin-like protein n=1 Tax=Cryptococcus depauperatus CBS 7841 TaxID=1295531 RepID=A0AAJ8JTG9_9TREE
MNVCTSQVSLCYPARISMPSRIPLPKLTLYTGGKECSLCEIAKEQLSILRRTHPFDLDLFNIRKPLPGVDPREAKKWRRLYQYDIPVLHLEEQRVQKHRIDNIKLARLLEEWKEKQEKELKANQKDEMD